jgi:hypothetical protein
MCTPERAGVRYVLLGHEFSGLWAPVGEAHVKPASVRTEAIHRAPPSQRARALSNSGGAGAKVRKRPAEARTFVLSCPPPCAADSGREAGPQRVAQILSPASFPPHPLARPRFRRPCDSLMPVHPRPTSQPPLAPLATAASAALCARARHLASQTTTTAPAFS